MTKLALIALLFLAGCQHNLTRSVVSAPLPPRIPQSLLQACPGVVDIPPRALASAETVRLWAKDRASLGECVRRHAGLARAATATTATK
jgi:hypothetical protein